MRHKNFFQFNADTNYEFGLKLGEAFKEQAQASITEYKSGSDWEQRLEFAKKYLPYTKELFPQLVEELE